MTETASLSKLWKNSPASKKGVPFADWVNAYKIAYNKKDRTETLEEFVSKKEKQNAIFGTASGFVTGILSGAGVTAEAPVEEKATPVDKKKKNVWPFIIGGVVIVGLIAVGIAVATKKVRNNGLN